MVGTPPTSQPIATDQWVSIQWAEYLHILEAPALEEARCYFDSGYMRLEMAPLGALHGRENSIISTLVVLFTTLKGMRMVELTNTTFRKAGLQDAQPDIAFYIGQSFTLPPRDNRPINVIEHGAPQLVIEIASTTLNDDLGRKRLLYERLGCQEYWVVDVEAAQVIAFAIADRRSGQIANSEVLPGLAIATVEEALRRSPTEDDATINRWLLDLFSLDAQGG
ncbi:Uma2 family endonuclease [Nodosilinea sp. LEGE 07298]|uniref:Uma2 family endonuclease n=1 Tax=Nodosilinea sp. LEGE 07298 TaxID=2777970 RepID=UPI00187FE096|nr:Uma2 family endonuclease [Nodosilinea sp. LEGE 07298]MBE9111123.1 Uma2 family endonuclease [Nodosilinea sp. LEGE 07298]